ncbi:MAG: hypothetical protein K9N36_10910 [Candidatus Marinimicrobia bacterium]|nr:hypothetical protein [Candidatus Neomarinimicrobiota bacterium]
MRDTSNRIPPARLYYFVSLVFLLIGSIWGQDSSFNFFPEDSWFKPLLLDPAAAQSSASLLHFKLQMTLLPRCTAR